MPEDSTNNDEETKWVDDWMGLTDEEMNKVLAGKDLMEHGEGIYETWVSLAFQPPPDDIIGRILWSAGVLGQLMLSVMTFPAALGAFLLEEAVQTYGMGAYMLSTSRSWRELDVYVDGFKEFIDSTEIGAKTLATLSPMTGGAVLIYMQAARQSARAFDYVAEANLFKEAEKDEALRQKELERMKYSEVRLSSSPSGAEIWIDGVNTELLTPETFKKLDVGPTVFEVRKYNKKTELWDVLVFEINLEPGRRKEILARIPVGIVGDGEPGAAFPTGILSIKSTPTNAQIWINGVDTETLTPETLKELTPGSYTIKLRAFTRRLATWDEYEFTINLERDTKMELKVNIPGKAYDEILTRLAVEETEESILPQWIKAEVTGEYAIDGDTFITSTGERIRILGIDAPEIGRPWADVSKGLFAEPN